MCSNACDNDLEDLSKEPQKVNFIGTLCRRCSEKACVVLRKKDPLCRICFLSYCTHKFRATIGKSHQVKPNQRVLLALSGGASSTALLHMINQGLQEEAHKKFLFKPFILFVDENPYPGWNVSNTQSYHQAALAPMLSSGHPCFVTSLDTVFSESETRPSYTQIQTYKDAESFFQANSEQTRLNACLENIQGVSCKEDFLRRIRWNLIRSVAGAEQMDFVFSGECCTFLATQVLTSMAQGRGSQVAQDTAFSDPFKGVPVLRPLREFQSKEIALYNQLHGLQYSVHPTLTTKLPACSSLHQVTEAFIVELQRDFPATVSTIFRTGDKLSSTPSSPQKICPLCHSSVDTDLPDSSAVAALKLSEEISRLCIRNDDGNGCCGAGKGGCVSKKEVSCSDLLPVLCFGCQKIVQNMKSPTFLPPEILHTARNLQTRHQMHEKIKDFLLEEDCS